MSKSLKLPTIIAKRLTALLIAIAVVVLIAGGVGVYVLQTKQAAADKLVDEKQAQVGSNEQITRRYQSTLDAYNATMEQLKYLEPSVPIKSYVPTLVQQLQNVSLADHLKVTAVHPTAIADPPAPKPAAGAETTAKPAPPPYKTMNVQVAVQGTYSQVMSFVYHMTKFQKIVSVQSILFSPQATGPNDSATGKAPMLTADLGMTAYIFDDAALKSALPGSAGATLTSTPAYDNNGNPIAAAASHVADVTRADMKSAGVHERTGGLLEPAATGKHSITGGFASEQNSVR